MARPMLFALAVLVAPGVGALGQPATPVAAPSAPVRISDALVSTLVGLAKARSAQTLLGLWKSIGRSTALRVRSNRELIAFGSAEAAETGGRFTPSAELRRDVVVVSCGDSDLGSIFECAQVKVTGPTGRRVTPVSYRAGPKSYRNAFGARWTVREVFATYHTRDLRNGFTVTFEGAQKTEWTLAVSPDEAEAELLLRLDPNNAADVLVPSGQRPPPQLDVSIERIDGGWRIGNQSPAYTWTQCEAAVESSVAKLPRLTPNETIVVRRSDFVPTLAEAGSSPMWVTCRVRDTRFTGSEHR